MNPEGNQVSSGSMPGMDMGTNSATPSATQSRAQSNREMKMIKVSGNCEMCKDRIEIAAKSVTGVSLADWSIDKKMLHVEFDGKKTNSDAIQKAIAVVGHDTEKYKAPDDVYKELPECCLFRK
jgi:Cu(I)/Ag(I) efflux system membrane fusion protein